MTVKGQLEAASQDEGCLGAQLRELNWGGGRLAQWPLDLTRVRPGWLDVVLRFFEQPEGRALSEFLVRELERGSVIFPPNPLRVLELTHFEHVQVVVVGQDPYHGHGQANGLAFSVNEGVSIPPSLRNIFKEIEQSVGVIANKSRLLQSWASQGVLLLNRVMTVEESHPGGHRGQGWEALTDQLIEAVIRRQRPLVFMLWGAQAQALELPIRSHLTGHQEVLILKSNHPSPFSANRAPVPFMGCNHFVLAKQWLESRECIVDWLGCDVG